MNHQVLIRFQLNLFKQEIRKSVLTSINVLILYGIRNNCLNSGRNRSLYLFIRVIKQTVVLIETYHCYQNTHKYYLPSCCQRYLHLHLKLLGITSADFDIRDLLLIILFCTCQIHEKNGKKMQQYICGL